MVAENHFCNLLGSWWKRVSNLRNFFQGNEKMSCCSLQVSFHSGGSKTLRY